MWFIVCDITKSVLVLNSFLSLFSYKISALVRFLVGRLRCEVPLRRAVHKFVACSTKLLLRLKQMLVMTLQTVLCNYLANNIAML